MIKIAYLLLGLSFTFAIPLGMLKLAIVYANYQEKSNTHDVRVPKSDSSNSGRK